MNPKLIKYNKVKKNSFDNVKVREYFSNQKSPFSLTFVKYCGRFPKTGYFINHKCNETYFIVKGSFKIEVKNDQVYFLEKYDSLFVPKGSIYMVEGEGKLIAINDPSWSEDQFEEIK